MAYSQSGQQGLYQAFPGGTGISAEIPELPPSTVKNAYYLMLVGAALSIISAIVDFGSRSARMAAERQAGAGRLTLAQVNAGVDLGYAIIIAIGLFTAGLWTWMAFANKAGKPWAGVTSTVLFGLYTVSELFTLSEFTPSKPATAVSVSGWVVGLAAVILIWNKASSAYYKPRVNQLMGNFPGRGQFPGKYSQQ